MFGDELDPTVMTERFGFGASFGRVEEGSRGLCREGGHLGKRRKQRQWGLMKGHEDKGGFCWSRRKKEERGPIGLREGQQGQAV